MATSANWPGRSDAPITHPFTIIPADSELADWARVVECTEECTLKVTTVDGTVITRTFYRGFNPVPVRQVWSTGSALGGAAVIGWY